MFSASVEATQAVAGSAEEYELQFNVAANPTAAGAAAGEILDPTKKMKDKNPVAAAAGGAAGGAIAGGGIGAASKALSNKFPETMSKIKNVVNPIKDKVSDIVGGKSVADNIKKNDALKDKLKNNPNKYFGTEVK